MDYHFGEVLWTAQTAAGKQLGKEAHGHPHLRPRGYMVNYGGTIVSGKTKYLSVR